MARRKRLEPARQMLGLQEDRVKTPIRSQAKPPVAEVAADAAATAALSEMADTLRRAREEGRMIIAIPLDQIDLDYLVRDRLPEQDADMQTLKDSIQQRGQQTSIEVVPLPDGRYGLISGWRRCQALRELFRETGNPDFETVLAVLRQHGEVEDSYVAMVEENEIRASLSFYERARIVAKSVEAGVYESDTAALRGLFGSVPRAKRSKIKSFLRIVTALDEVLVFPSSLSEKLGLELSGALDKDPSLADSLRARLARVEQVSSDVELGLIREVLDAHMAGAKPRKSPLVSEKKPSSGDAERNAQVAAQTVQPVSGVFLRTDAHGRLLLYGDGVTPELRSDLLDWLTNRT